MFPLYVPGHPAKTALFSYHPDSASVNDQRELSTTSTSTGSYSYFENPIDAYSLDWEEGEGNARGGSVGRGRVASVQLLNYTCSTLFTQ
jgi:hypothetical protein